VRADATGEVTGQAPYGVDAGAADAYEWNFLTDDTTYVDGKIYKVKVATANTGACTGNVNGWGAKNIKKNHNIAPETGDFVANMQIELQYNSTTDTLNLISPTNHEGLLSASRICGSAVQGVTVTVANGATPYPMDSETFDILGEMNGGYQAVTCTAGTGATTVVASGATFTAADVGRMWYNSTRSLFALITAFNSSTSITVDSFAGQASGDTGYIYGTKFTAAVTGYYQVNLSIPVTVASATQQGAISLYKNGAVYAKHYIIQSGANTGSNWTTSVAIADVVQLNAGEYIQPYVQSVSGTWNYGINPGGTTAWFSVKRVA